MLALKACCQAAEAEKMLGGGQLEGYVRTGCKLAGSLLLDSQTYYFLSTIVLRNSKKKSVARVLKLRVFSLNINLTQTELI